MKTLKQIAEHFFNDAGNTKSPNHSQESYCRKHDFYDSIMHHTAILPESEPIGSRLRYISVGCPKPAVCKHPGCGKTTNWVTQIKAWNEFCSRQCSAASQSMDLAFGKAVSAGIREKVDQQDRMKKQKKTLKKRYGERVDHVKRINYTPEQLDFVNDPAKYYREWHIALKMPIYAIGLKLGFHWALEHSSCGVVADAFKALNLEIKEWNNISWPHQQIIDFLKSLGLTEDVDFKVNDWNVLTDKKWFDDDQELDITLLPRGLAIEINGTYFHHEGVQNRGRTYHRNKTLACAEKGIRLLQFWDTQIKEQWDIVSSMIRQACELNGAKKLDARKLDLVAGDSNKKEIMKLLEENHIQGKVEYRVAYTLYDGTTLVAAMLFNTAYRKGGEWDLNRYVTDRKYSIRGGASKLFKHFVTDMKPKCVVSFSDMMISDGDMYRKLGFKDEGISCIPYYWLFRKKLITRHSTKKLGMIRLLKDKYDTGMSETQNMESAGAKKVWGAGIVKWSKEF